MASESPNHTAPINLDDDAGELAQHAVPVTVEKTATVPPPTEPIAANKRLEEFATRANLMDKDAMDKKKLALLGGGLIAAVLFFLFTQFQPHPVRNARPADQKKQQAGGLAQPQPPASKTPIMEPVTVTNSDQDGGKVSASDIARTRKPDYNRSSSGSHDATPPQYAAGGGRSLGDVPSFSDTQQKFEDPSPYKGGSSSAPGAASQEASAMKEASLVYVRAPEQGLTGKHADHGEELPVLQLKEGTRVEARLETQISSDIHAPVVAVVENTYAVGDQVLVPAGARLFGRIGAGECAGRGRRRLR